MQSIRFITDAAGRELHVLDGVIVGTTNPEDAILVGMKLDEI